MLKLSTLYAIITIFNWFLLTDYFPNRVLPFWLSNVFDPGLHTRVLGGASIHDCVGIDMGMTWPAGSS